MRQLILNVDDFEPQRYVRSAVLRSAGFDVLEAATGREALAAAREHQPALVVLDVHLPDIDGREVCRAIKRDAVTAGVLVLHVSATFREAAFRIRALENGADGYLAEPVEADELVAQVRALLRLAAAEREARLAQRALLEREASYRRAEEELRASEERLRLAQQAGHLGVYDWDLTTGEVVWTAELETVFGIQAPPDPAARRAAWLQLVHPDDRERLIRETTEWLESEQPERRWEYRLLRSDGEERWIAGQSLVLRDAEGRPLRVIGTNEDITERKRTDRVLHDTHDLLRAVLNAAPAGIVVADASGRIVAVSGATSDVFGGPVTGDAHGADGGYVLSTPDGALAPDDRLPLSRALGGESVVDCELVVSRQDGERRVLLSSASPLRTLTGQVRGAVTVFQDITERKRVEQALRESEGRLAAALAIGRLGVWEYDIPTAHTLFDDRCREVFGIAASRPVPNEEVFALVHPDDRCRVEEDVRRALAASGDGLYDTEYRVVRPDGTERWVAVRGNRFPADTGRAAAPGRFVGTMMDITGRKRREQQVAAQNELLSAITDNIPVLLVLWDPALNTFRFNRHMRETLGWTEADTTDGRFMERVYPDAAYRVVVSHYMRSLEPGWRDLQTTARDGTVVDISWANVQLSGGLYIGIGVDVRERKRLEATLQEANARLEDADRRKDEFIAVLSHELRNPLAPIRYAVPLIQRQQPDESAARALAVIERQTEHLTRLVDDLLDLSRITSGNITLRRDYVTLGAVVTAAIEAASAAVATAHHTLQVDVNPEPVWLHADAARLAQVLTNLLDNSAKYTPAGGQIVLTARREDGEAVIRVRDNGIGIPREALPSVFEMFHRVHREHEQGGLGIGLALSKRLVQMHGGHISAASAGPGQGTEVTVRVPIALGVEPDRLPEGTGAAAVRQRRLKVLVVDDNLDLVEMLALVVEGAGHEVRKAFDGRSALSAALSYRPDVVLLDLGLPGMNGVEVGRELRRRQETAKALIVALTGLGQPEDRRQTEEAGFDHHLTKPTAPEEVERLLARFAASLPS